MKFNIFGAGLYGLTLGRLLYDNGHDVTIYERENHIGGMLHTHRRMGVEIHEHGAHIFHTDNDRVIEFVKKYTDWTPYYHQVKAKINILGREKYISLPLSYQSVCDLYNLDGRTDKVEVCEYILSSTSRKRHPNPNIENLISKIGWDLYEYVIKPYSEKQWGMKFEDINPSVIDRIGMTQDFNTNYFKDKFQALPTYGYDDFLNSLSSKLMIVLNSEFFYDPDKVTIYTGAIDDLINDNILPYRSLIWETHSLPGVTFHNYPVVNTPQDKYSTRIIYHSNFINNVINRKTFYSLEYPMEWTPGLSRYYPINSKDTDKVYQNAVSELKLIYPKLYLGGRLGLYKYLDMDDTIFEAMKLFDRLCKI